MQDKDTTKSTFFQLLEPVCKNDLWKQFLTELIDSLMLE